MGVIQCAKVQFQGKICTFSVKIATKLLHFSKFRAKRAKICNFYVKFDTNVEKRGVIGCGLNEKRGSLGEGSA